MDSISLWYVALIFASAVAVVLGGALCIWLDREDDRRDREG